MKIDIKNITKTERKKKRKKECTNKWTRVKFHSLYKLEETVKNMSERLI